MSGALYQPIIRSGQGRERGSALILVVIMTAALSLVGASLLNLGATERRLNKSSFLHRQAQNGAESMVEYGFAELKNRWRRETSFPNVALRLNNGSEIPNPDFSKKSGYDQGFTLATNGQLYIKGHYNADGKSNTGSSTETDDGATFGSAEATAALYADAITILSEDFDDSMTKKHPRERKATFTEVSAALVTGLLPTVPGQFALSGGAHNLPRFLENWGGVEFRYRGSLVALYESEAAIKPMTSSHSSWYSPSNRNWGYNQVFKDGIYPPGTPNVRDFRRTDFRFLTEAEFLAELNDIDGYDAKSDSHGHLNISAWASRAKISAFASSGRPSNF